MRKFFVAFALCVGMIAGGASRAENNCTGATYYDADTDTCVACPGGYDYNTDSGKTDITQCQIHCDAGTWIGDYTRLEYIESTGTQWINTGVAPMANFKIYLDGMIVSGGNGKRVFGTSGASIDVYIYSNTVLASGINSNFGSGGIGTGGIGNRFYIGLSPHWTQHYNGTQTTLERPYTPSGTLTLLATSASSAHVAARIYEAKLYNGDALTFRGIPVRRNSDGAVGLYDTVSNRFVGNSGTGTFIAGPVVGRCVNVGTGYWAAASTVNFGSAGVRNACAAGTYSDIETGSSASVCTPCAGATYSSAGAAVCTACPAEYDYNTDSGKTDITQCQIHCDAGTYIESIGSPLPADCVQLEYIESTGAQYINTGYTPTTLTRTEVDLKFTDDTYKSSGGETFFGVTNHSINFGDKASEGYQLFPWTCAYGTSGCNVSSFNINSTLKTTRQTVVLDAKNKIVSYGNVQRNLSQTPGIPQGSIYLFGTHSIATNGTEAGVTLYSRNDGMFVYAARIYENNILVRNFIPVRCNSDNVVGMYDMITGTFLTNSGAGTFVVGPDVGPFGGECVNVGAGYWAAASTVNFGSLGTKNACPVGTTTVGYGHGADSANDCGRVLHIGDYVLYARRDRVTSPSLNIRIPEEGIIYYINLGSANHDLSRLHLMLDGVQYTAYDDSLYYGERDFDTGEQIAQ